MKRLEQRRPEPTDLLLQFARELTQVRSAAALHRLLIDTAVRLASPRRALLVLESPHGLQVAAARLPRSESAAALLAAVTPWLNEVRERRAAALHIGPPGASPAGQRCCIVAPLIGAQDVLGFLYCDAEGRHGRWNEVERDRLALLACQAALALENTRLFDEAQEALERQTATAQILQVIASSPSDVQPVFDAIVRNAVGLCGGLFANVFRFDGELLHWAASHNLAPQSV